MERDHSENSVLAQFSSDSLGATDTPGTHVCASDSQSFTHLLLASGSNLPHTRGTTNWLSDGAAAPATRNQQIKAARRPAHWDSSQTDGCGSQTSTRPCCDSAALPRPSHLALDRSHWPDGAQMEKRAASRFLHTATTKTPFFSVQMANIST